MATNIGVYEVSQQHDLFVPVRLKEIHESEMQVIENVAERRIDVGVSVAYADSPINARTPKIGNLLKSPTFRTGLAWNGLSEHTRNTQQCKGYKEEKTISHGVTPVSDF